MIPSFGVKKAQPAFQAKTAAPVASAAENSSTAALPPASVNSATTPAGRSSPAPATAAAGSPEVAPLPVAVSSNSKALPAAALIPTSTLPPAVLPPQDAGACDSDEDFEKENILIDPNTKKPAAKSKKLKVKKDPNVPKKPVTSYMFFCKQERRNVTNELGNIGFTATGVEVARRWGMMDATEKAKWTEEAAKDKERFNEENAAYLAKKRQAESIKADDANSVGWRETSSARPMGSLTKVAKSKTSGKGKLLALKETVGVTSKVGCSSGDIPLPVAKYFAFLFSHWAGVRQEHPNSSPKEIQDLLWKQWNLTGGRGAASDFLRGGEGDAKNEGEALETGGPAMKKAKKEKKDKDPLVPKKPPSAYLLFFHSMKAEVMASKPELTYREVMTEMGRVWNQELVEEQKAPFHAQRQQLMVEWEKAMDAYRLDNIKKGHEVKIEGAEVVEGHVLENGDGSNKEQPKDVEKDEQGREFREEDGWTWTDGDGDTEMEKVEHDEVKKEGGKGEEDVEIDGREEGLEGDIRGEIGDPGSI